MATRVKTLHFSLGNPAYAIHTIEKCWTEVGGVWVNETTDINSSSTADVPMGAAVNDAIYFGMSDIFAGLSFETSTAPAGSVIWEYWNGSSWAAYGSTQLPTDSAAVGNAPPDDWATTQVNGEVDGPWFYLRCRKTGAGTAGTLSYACIGNVLRVADTRSIEVTDMLATRNIRMATLRFTFGSSL